MSRTDCTLYKCPDQDTWVCCKSCKDFQTCRKGVCGFVKVEKCLRAKEVKEEKK